MQEYSEIALALLVRNLCTPIDWLLFENKVRFFFLKEQLRCWKFPAKRHNNYFDPIKINHMTWTKTKNGDIMFCRSQLLDKHWMLAKRQQEVDFLQ